MAMKKLALPILLMAGLTFVTIGVLWAVDDPLILDNKFGKVELSHEKHSALKCQDCHHTLEEGQESPQKCGECHNEGADVGRKKAFHDNCKGCHKKMAQGPTKCKECHQK
jgi:hypothetical protein